MLPVALNSWIVERRRPRMVVEEREGVGQGYPEFNSPTGPLQANVQERCGFSCIESWWKAYRIVQGGAGVSVGE